MYHPPPQNHKPPVSPPPVALYNLKIHLKNIKIFNQNIEKSIYINFFLDVYIEFDFTKMGFRTIHFLEAQLPRSLTLLQRHI